MAHPKPVHGHQPKTNSSRVTG